MGHISYLPTSIPNTIQSNIDGNDQRVCGLIFDNGASNGIEKLYLRHLKNSEIIIMTGLVLIFLTMLVPHIIAVYSIQVVKLLALSKISLTLLPLTIKFSSPFTVGKYVAILAKPLSSAIVNL